MWDFGCIAISILFFAIAIAYTAGCDPAWREGRKTMIETALLIVVTLALLIYLVFALLLPEKF